MKKTKDFFKIVMNLPIIIYALILILLPLLYIFVISFFKNDVYGGIIQEFTLNNYIRVFEPVYIGVFFKSFIIAAIATIICILIAYPFTIFVSRKSEIAKNVIMTLVIIPSLTNSLIRMYGWIILLRKSGVINTTLMNLCLIESPLELMYNYGTIVLGLVYTLLPFMILPLYSAVSKINPSIINASHDLGANSWKTFTKIIFPLTVPGLFNGSLMVFIPSLAYFFISDILGGGKLMLIGNLIKNQFLTARNWPFGAAISIILLLITFILVAIYKKLGGKMDDLGGGL